MKVDLHTHSTASSDGGIRPEAYARLLDSGLLDAVAVTDHNTITGALQLHGQIGSRIIVGEEITTHEGELIGLFLQQAVTPGQTAQATAEAIKAQGGLVYVPHPFETLRSGLSEATLNDLADMIDIVEAHNGRALFQNRGPLAATWARLHRKVMAASSDAHGIKGVGTTFTTIQELPTVKNLVSQLDLGRLITHRPPLYALLYPKLNRLTKRLNRQ